MYGPEYFSDFVDLTCELLDVNEIIWIYEKSLVFEKGGRKYACCNIACATDFLDHFKNEQLRIISFDLHLIPVIASLRLITGILNKRTLAHELAYIQHGTFSDLASEIRTRYSLKWVMNSFFGFKLFLSSAPFKNAGSMLYLCLKSFIFGSFRCRERLSELTPPFATGIFWNKSDIELLGNKVTGNISRIVITSPPDIERVEFLVCMDAPPLYIAQPLAEDNLVSTTRIKSFHKQLLHDYPEVVCLLHPRSDTSLFSIFSTDSLVRLGKNKAIIRTSLVLGHFSSLLLVVPDNIPLQTFDLGDSGLSESVDRFKKSRSGVAREATVQRFIDIGLILNGQ